MMATKTDAAILKCKYTCPSLFDLKILQEKNMQYLASIREKISQEMNKSGFETDAEWEAAINLIAFIHWLMDEEKEAMKYTDDVLMRNSENVIALANQMWMYREKGLTGAAEIMDKLKVLGSRRNLVNRAKFEQANAYSRFGPRFYKYSIDLFQEIIDDEGTDVENLYLSKFGLALLLKRQFNVYNIFCFEHLSDFENSAKRTINVIYDVAKNANIDRFRARGWAMLGEIISLLKYQQHTDFNLQHILPTSIKHMTLRDFFEKAYIICNDDVYVLERFGKEARYWKDYRRSEMLLRRSLEIRKTAFAHHQLALTLRSVLNSSIISSRRTHRSRKEEQLSKHSIPEEYKTVKFIVAPKQVLPYSHDNRTAEILSHLEQSLECSPSNSHAMCDKGLLFRSLGWYDKAIEVFVQATTGKECAPLYEVRCLEQHALCLIHLASTQPSGISTVTLYEKAKHLIIQALQKSAYIATNAPLVLKAKFPSIKDMLTKEKQKEGYLFQKIIEELDHLYQFVGEYGQVLPFYKEISEMSEEDANNPNIMFTKAESYLMIKDFSNSVLLLDLMEVSSSRLEGRNRKLYFEAYLESALNEVDQETVKMRFKRAVQFCSKGNFGSSGDRHEFEYDITILSSDSLKQESSAIHQVFTHMCRLSVSLNNVGRTPGRLETNASASIMQPSCLIVFVFNEEVIYSNYISMAMKWNRQEGFGCGIISICLGHENVPAELQQFPVFYQPNDLVISKLSKDGKHQWIREFFWKSVEQTFPTDH